MAGLHIGARHLESVPLAIPHWTGAAPRSADHFGQETHVVPVRVSQLKDLDDPITRLQLAHLVTKLSEVLALHPGIRNVDIDRDFSAADICERYGRWSQNGPLARAREYGLRGRCRTDGSEGPGRRAASGEAAPRAREL